jgi:ligand-binding SRPBCC domain-containing protein
MDSQLKGPYDLWDHVHRFETVGGGTLMTDEVVYRVPLGPIGHIVNEVVIKGDVRTIFDYRTKRMAGEFSV